MKVSDVRPFRACSPGRRLFTAGLVGFCCLIAWSWPASTDAQTSGAQAGWSGDIIVTQIPINKKLESTRPPGEAIMGPMCGDGGRLVLVRSGQRPVSLTANFQSACDPHVSFDGGRLLFAGKKKASDAWNIFEMAVDGTNVRQITHDTGNCRHPIYQGTLFTLDSKEPWYQICFVSDAAAELNEFGGQTATDLYSCKIDGTEPRRLTFNPSADVDPWMLPDGRMVYASWEVSTPEHGGAGRVALFAINIDGTDNLIFSGDEGLSAKRMPCVTPSGLVVFTEADRAAWDGAGRLASVSLRRNLHSHRFITSQADGLFVSPSPLPDGQVLVSRRDDAKLKTHGVWRIDPASGRMSVVFDDPKYHDIQAQAIAPQPVPDGRSTVVLESESTGKLYCLNTFISDLPEDQWVRLGTALRLRVLEGLPESAKALIGRGKKSASAGSAAHSDPVRKRLLGEIPVEPDGSFNLEAPADIPIQLQLIDSHGLALRTSHWIWVKKKENRGCIGCHEDGERTPPNRFASALSHPSTPLTLPPGKRRTVDFRRDVMPIIAAKCATAACHGAAAASVPLDASLEPVSGHGFNRSYATLTVASPEDEPGRYVHPGRARTSPLVWHLFARNTSQSWDPPDLARRAPKPMPPGAPALTQQERRVFVEWIDLGALWDSLPATQPKPAAGAKTITHGGAR